tara:strand:- start:223118 stop:225013 length:1896 start_codon:yes stop_codon:yes gene_type:complete
MSSTLAFAQKDSKGDFYFFEYAYKDAIREYNKELIKKNLTKQQYLNLADSYLKTGNFKKASELYIDSYSKDSTLANTYVNKLLLSIGKTDGLERVKYYLSKSSSFLSKELLENADFNFEILEKNQDTGVDFYVFNCYLNSPQADFSPAFYDDELLFTSGRQKDKKEIYKPSGEAYLDIYSGTIQADGDVTIPKTFSKVPNSDFHKATPFYAQDLNTIIYMLSNADNGELLFDKNGKNTLAIGSVNEKGRFQYLLRDLSTSFYYPFYEEKTGKLYFAANFENGYGGTDIYYVNTNNGQIMSAPTNLGPRINTPGNEIAPFIFDGSLYFSSDIFYGLGGMDIYTSNIQLDGSYSIPVNLGNGINSISDDFGFIIKNNAKDNSLLGYFSSNREGGKGKDDIYGFKVSEKPGLKTLVVKGTVMNPTKGNTIENVVVNLLDSDGQVLKEFITGENGNYQFEIPFRTVYGIMASKKGHGIFSKSFTANNETNQAQNLIINLPFIQDVVEEKENKTVLKIKKFYFTAGTSIISPEIAYELDKIVEIANNFPKIKLKIETHTNSRGSNITNLALSQSRSDAIKKYLLNKGVSKNNITETVGYGESKLVNQCKDGVFCLEFLHNQNERSLISVLNYDELK